MIIPDSVKYVIENGQMSVFYLVELMFDVPLRHTTYYRDLPTAFGLFSSDNSITAVDAPRMSSSVDRATYKIVYADPTFSMRALLEDGIAGRKASVWAGVINTTNVTVAGISPGQPLVDYVLVYSGFIDTSMFKTDGEETTVIFECASLMAGLDVVKEHITSVNYVKSLDAADTSFDQVYAGSRAVNLLWGKR